MLKRDKEIMGKKWGELGTELQGLLLLTASAVDGATCNEPEETMECIIDLNRDLSINGKIIKGEEEDEIIIEDDAIIYSPNLVSLYAPQKRWQKKVGLIAKSYKLNIKIVERFSAACNKAGTTQAKQLTKMMEEFSTEELGEE